MNLPMYIPGVGASKISTYAGIKDLILTKDMLLACTTSTEFKSLLYSEWGDYIASDSIDSCTFNYSSSYGPCLRLGNTIYDLIPIFTTKDIPIPKSIYINFYYAGGSSRMCNFVISSTTESLGFKYLIRLVDSHYTNDSSHSVKFQIDNSNKTIYSYGGTGAFSRSYTVTIPDEVPNCISDTDKTCVISLSNCLTYESYTTSPAYITELKILF